MAEAFGTTPAEAVEVHIAARMKGAELERRTLLKAGGQILRESAWTTLRRSR